MAIIQGGRAMKIYPSDTIDIPNINNLYASGTNTSTTASKLISTSGNFINLGVKVGDIVYNLGLPSDVPSKGVATVTAIDSVTQLSLSADIFSVAGGNGNVYRIFRAVQNGGDINSGCIILPGAPTVGNGGNIRVLTIGGDDTILNVAYGIPVSVQVVRIFSSGTIVANLGYFTAIW